MRCRAKTKAGKRCKRSAKTNRKTCGGHKRLRKASKRSRRKRRKSRRRRNPQSTFFKEEKAFMKKYFALKSKIRKETQFNRKIDLNAKAQELKKSNPEFEAVPDSAGGEKFYIGGVLIVSSTPQFSKRRVNLAYKRLAKDKVTWHVG